MQVDRSRAPASFAYSGGGLSLPRANLVMPTSNRQDGSDLHEIILVWIKYWRWIAGTSLACVVMALLFLLIVQPQYTSTISLLVDAYGRSAGGLDVNAGANAAPDPNLVESQLKILSSPTVLKRVITTLNLDQDSEFIGSSSDNLSPEVRTVKALAALAKKMVIKKSERTYVVDIELSTNKAEKSAQIANSIAEAYVADQNETRVNSTKRDLQAVAKKLAQQQIIVRDAFSQIQKFKQDNHISDVNGKLLNEQELSDLTTAINLARMKTRDLKSRTEQWQKYVNSGKPLQARPEGPQSGTLERLWSNYADIVKQQGNYRTTLGDKHPALQEVETQLKDIRRLIDNEMRTIIQSAQAEYQIALENEKELNRRLNESRSQTDNINVQLVKLKELERNAEAEKQIYDRLLKSRDMLGSESGEGSSVRVIAAATPALESSYPKSIPILSIALAVGLFVSAGGVLFKDFIDTRSQQNGGSAIQAPMAPYSRPAFSSTPTYRQSIGQFWVVAVPDLRQDQFVSQRMHSNMSSFENGQSFDLFTLMTAADSFPNSRFTKAIDQTRDYLLQSWSRLKMDEVKTILVTSRLSQAGKTSLCTNLALRLSLLGLRVVIVDTDTDHSGLSKLITETAEPSLISLSGHTRLVYRIKSDWVNNISIVPILSQEEQIIRRLQKKNSGRPMSGFKRNFDVVIIDGSEFTDQSSLDQFSKSVDHVLVVVDGQREDASQIEMIAEQFKSTKVNLSGFIIAKVQSR
ncbi:MAG: hypothetical protein EB015_03410 [Methylocystaceae bacterium]|nr:hypothetical protein [Methylocystaceae bacterium]